jgi:histidinol-phosphate/aromatic aminotransferase/cobyric acid decarboxylase-like protein/choline kinase
MRAIILAAGIGRRMRPLTLTTHKSLLKIGDRTLLGRLIDMLIAHGVTNVAIVTGYRAEEIRQHALDLYPDLDFLFVHNDRYAETNNIYSLALALEQVPMDDDIVLIESDLVVELAVFNRLFASPEPNVALLDRYRSGMDGTVVTVVDNVVRSVIPPHLQGSDFNFADKYKTLNIYKFSQAFCLGSFKRLITYYAQAIDSNCYYEAILGIIITMQQEVIHAAILQNERWAELDDPNDLDSARYTFEADQRYSALQRSQGSYWNYEVLDFCFLRNMYFPTGSVLSELRNALPTLLHNYGSTQTLLDRKLSYYLLCQPERCIALNGASQAFPLLAQFFAGRRVLIPCPTFGEYRRIFPTAAEYFDEIGFDLDLFLPLAQDAEVIVFVNPNNPTGTLLPSDWIYNFAVDHPEKWLIVDESFIDFADRPSMMVLLEEQPLDNVILLKSLSKTLGVPGLRLGYTYSSNAEFNLFMRSHLPIWNLNSLAEHFLEIILKHREAIATSFQSTARDRVEFAEMLATLPSVAKVFASGGNFLLVKLHLNRSSAQALAETLLTSRSIYIKDVSSRFKGEGVFFRLAVRTHKDHLHLVRAMEDLAIKLPYSQDLSNN